MQIATEISPTELKVTSPYNPAVIAELRSRGGKWDGTSWVFSAGSVKNGLAAIKELFGLSEEIVTIQVGKADAGTAYLTNAQAAEKGLPLPFPERGPQHAGSVQVRPAVHGWKNDQYLTIGGYILASRKGRDSRADIIETLVSGKIPSGGGSVKNPSVNASDDCVFELDVRKDWAIANGFFAADEQAALRLEKAALLARIVEIDAELSR